jgi:hypothetical protein
MTEAASKTNCLNVPNPARETNETIKSGYTPERDNNRDNAGTFSLKALARRHFQRDKGRDNSATIIPSVAELEAAAEAALEATERAAIISEGEHGNARASVPHRLPPSWVDARIEPTLGAACHCCKRGRWWCETVNPSGWRCMTCHPPGHLSAGQYREVRT